MTDEARLAETLKDVADNHGLVRVAGAYRSGADEWTEITVREPGTLDPIDEWPDGWMVERKVTAL